MEIEQLLKLDDVLKMTSLSRTEVYRRIKDGRFPNPYKLGLNRVAWKLSEVQKWVDELR